MATSFAPAESDLKTLDVSKAELYQFDKWHEPFRRLRHEAPLHYCKDSKFGPYWSVSTYKPIVHIEALPKIFSSSFEYGGISIGLFVDRLLEGEFRQPQFIAMDPPRHAGQRRTIAPAFGPSEIARMRDEVRGRTAALLEALPIGQAFEWVETVSIELTTGMLAKLFDFSWEERHCLTRWSDTLGDVELAHAPGGMAIRNEQAFEMADAFNRLWESKKGQAPGHDLISMMLHSDAMNEMSQEEFIGNLILLIVGGNDTTRNSMSGSVYGLHQFHEERAKLEADPSLIPNAVSELIRWQTPLAHMRRTVLEDCEVEGHMLRKGDKVVLWYISANRDETVFEDPDCIRLDRENARRHLAFGYGIHRCVGARLAELQLTVLLEEMSRLRLRAKVLAEPQRVAACFVHGYKKMLVELERY